jgi:hypothetical protein
MHAKVEICNTLCYNFPNYLHWSLNHASNPLVNEILSKIKGIQINFNLNL